MQPVCIASSIRKGVAVNLNVERHATMDYQDRHVVVTGGTGALGTAVLDALLQAGAVCHVPYRTKESVERSPHQANERVSFVAINDLADEAAVMQYYDGLKGLWAAVHIAGAFASASIAESDMAVLMKQLEANLFSTYLCSRAAALKLRQLGSGGAHRECRRTTGTRAAPRLGERRLHDGQGSRCGTYHVAGCRARAVVNRAYPVPGQESRRPVVHWIVLAATP
jgi:NAD(P)-dependent dehydrogenase (short-subunit alcohol dehydrogenase family)